MDPEEWTIKSHTISASHIRGYVRGVKNPRAASLKLAVKQYIPITSTPPSDNAATIVFCHGVGSTKESYEPFFAHLKNVGLEIRSIWAADIPWHGQSYLLNETSIGDAPHWDDTARDIIHMINVFQEDMPPPLIGIGQSWGGYPIFRAALYHPRLFAAIVPMEPYLGGGGDSRVSNYGSYVTVLMARRKDNWKSLDEAKEKLSKIPYFVAFDKDVFKKVIENDLRKRPDGSVELLTPKVQEVGMMVRLVPSKDINVNDGPDHESRKDYLNTPEQHPMPGFYRAEPAAIIPKVQEVIPPVLYVWGSESALRFSSLRQSLMENTGTAPGANGGEKKGMVASVTVNGSAHPMPLEKPKETAEVIVPWIKDQITKWDKDIASSLKGQFWTKKLNPKWLEAMSKI